MIVRCRRHAPAPRSTRVFFYDLGVGARWGQLQGAAVKTQGRCSVAQARSRLQEELVKVEAEQQLRQVGRRLHEIASIGRVEGHVGANPKEIRWGLLQVAG